MEKRPNEKSLEPVKILAVIRLITFNLLNDSIRAKESSPPLLSAGTFHPIETTRAPAVNYRPIRRSRLSKRQIKRLSILTAPYNQETRRYFLARLSFVSFRPRAYALTYGLFLL